MGLDVSCNFCSGGITTITFISEPAECRRFTRSRQRHSYLSRMMVLQENKLPGKWPRVLDHCFNLCCSLQYCMPEGHNPHAITRFFHSA